MSEVRHTLNSRQRLSPTKVHIYNRLTYLTEETQARIYDYTDSTVQYYAMAERFQEDPFPI